MPGPEAHMMGIRRDAERLFTKSEKTDGHFVPCAPRRHLGPLFVSHLNETVTSTASRLEASLWESGCKSLLRSTYPCNWIRRYQCPLRLKTASTVGCRC